MVKSYAAASAQLAVKVTAITDRQLWPIQIFSGQFYAVHDLLHRNSRGGARLGGALDVGF